MGLVCIRRQTPAERTGKSLILRRQNADRLPQAEHTADFLLRQPDGPDGDRRMRVRARANRSSLPDFSDMSAAVRISAAFPAAASVKTASNPVVSLPARLQSPSRPASLSSFTCL